VQVEPLRLVPRSENLHGIGGHLRGRGDLGQKPAVRTAESELPVRLSIDLVASFMDGAVMPATEQSKIRERGGAPLGPVTDVMALADPNPAAWEATAAVAVVEGPPQRRRDRAGPGSDLHHAPIGVVPHHHAAGVARQALGRSSWNARAVLEDGLARRIGVRQDLGLDVDHDLVALARGAGIEAVVQGGLGQQRQSVGLLLLHRRRVGLRPLVAPALIQRLARGGERLD
jgi:hypothetical protein